jgi:hypothetical protein
MAASPTELPREPLGLGVQPRCGVAVGAGLEAGGVGAAAGGTNRGALPRGSVAGVRVGDGELGVVTGRLGVVTGRLGVWTGRLGAGWLGAWTGRLGAWTGRLGACTGRLGAWTGRLGACTGRLGAWTGRLGAGRLGAGRLGVWAGRLGAGRPRSWRCRLVAADARGDATSSAHSAMATDVRRAGVVCAAMRGPRGRSEGSCWLMSWLRERGPQGMGRHGFHGPGRGCTPPPLHLDGGTAANPVPTPSGTPARGVAPERPSSAHLVGRRGD